MVSTFRFAAFFPANPFRFGPIFPSNSLRLGPIFQAHPLRLGPIFASRTAAVSMVKVIGQQLRNSQDGEHDSDICRAFEVL